MTTDAAAGSSTGSRVPVLGGAPPQLLLIARSPYLDLEEIEKAADDYEFHHSEFAAQEARQMFKIVDNETQ